jgi:hypothetical protein
VLFGETVAVYCENHVERTDTFCGGRMQNVCMLNQVVNILTTMLLCFTKGIILYFRWSSELTDDAPWISCLRNSVISVAYQRSRCFPLNAYRVYVASEVLTTAVMGLSANHLPLLPEGRPLCVVLKVELYVKCLKVCANMALKGQFEPKRDDVT